MYQAEICLPDVREACKSCTNSLNISNRTELRNPMVVGIGNMRSGSIHGGSSSIRW